MGEYDSFKGSYSKVQEFCCSRNENQRMREKLSDMRKVDDDVIEALNMPYFTVSSALYFDGCSRKVE